MSATAKIENIVDGADDDVGCYGRYIANVYVWIGFHVGVKVKS